MGHDVPMHMPALFSPARWLAQHVGRFALDRMLVLQQMATIFVAASRSLLQGKVANPAVRSVFARQGVAIILGALPLVCAVGLVVGIVCVHYILTILLGYLGNYEDTGAWLVFVMLEFVAPSVTTLLILLRSGTATVAELSLMRLSGELDTLAAFGVQQGDYIHLPRLLVFLIAGPVLTLVFCFVALVGGFLIVGYLHDITLNAYLDQLLAGTTLRSLVLVVTKPALLSLAVGLVCLQRGTYGGVGTGRALVNVPANVSLGMMQAIILLIGLNIFITALAAL